MTPKQADTLIKNAKPVTLRNTYYNETITLLIVSRDRNTVTCENGGRFDRRELVIVKDHPIG